MRPAFRVIALLLTLLVVASGRRPKSRARDWSGGDDGGAIPGTAGLDYPTLTAVPRTSFSCHGKPEGFYADSETRCQVFHICSLNTGSMVQQSFLCPNGTLFNQPVNTCDWWNKVHCDSDGPGLDAQPVVSRGEGTTQTTGDPGDESEQSNEPSRRNMFREFSVAPDTVQVGGISGGARLHVVKTRKNYRKNSRDFSSGYTNGYFKNALTTELPPKNDFSNSPDDLGRSPSTVVSEGVPETEVSIKPRVKYTLSLKSTTNTNDYFKNALTTELPPKNYFSNPQDDLGRSPSTVVSEGVPETEVSINPRVKYTPSLKSTTNSPLYSLSPIIQVARDSSLLSSFTNSPYSQDAKRSRGKTVQISSSEKKQVQRFVVDGVLPQYGNGLSEESPGNDGLPGDDDSLESEEAKKTLGEDDSTSGMTNPQFPEKENENNFEVINSQIPEKERGVGVSDEAADTSSTTQTNENDNTNSGFDNNNTSKNPSDSINTDYNDQTQQKPNGDESKDTGVNNNNFNISPEIGYDYPIPDNGNSNSKTRTKTNNFFVRVSSGMRKSYNQQISIPGIENPSIVRLSGGYSFKPVDRNNNHYNIPKHLRVTNSYSIQDQFATASPSVNPYTGFDNTFNNQFETSSIPPTNIEFMNQQAFFSQEQGGSTKITNGQGRFDQVEYQNQNKPQNVNIPQPGIGFNNQFDSSSRPPTNIEFTNQQDFFNQYQGGSTTFKNGQGRFDQVEYQNQNKPQNVNIARPGIGFSNQFDSSSTPPTSIEFMNHQSFFSQYQGGSKTINFGQGRFDQLEYQNQNNPQSGNIAQPGIGFNNQFDTSSTPPASIEFTNQQSVSSQEQGGSKKINNGQATFDQFEYQSQNNPKNINIAQPVVGDSTGEQVHYLDQPIVNESDLSSSVFNDDPKVNNVASINSTSSTETSVFDDLLPTPVQDLSSYFPGSVENGKQSAVQPTLPSNSADGNFEEPNLNNVQTTSSDYISLTTEENVSPNFSDMTTENEEFSKLVTMSTTSTEGMFDESPTDKTEDPVDYKFKQINITRFPTKTDTAPNTSPRPHEVPSTFRSFSNSNPNDFSNFENTKIPGHYITLAPSTGVIPSVKSQQGKQTQSIFNNKPVSVDGLSLPRFEGNTKSINNQFMNTESSPFFNGPAGGFTGLPPTPLSTPQTFPATGFSTSSLRQNTQLFQPSVTESPSAPISGVYSPVSYKQGFPITMVYLSSKPAFENSHLALPEFPPQSGFYSLDPRLTNTPTTIPPKGSRTSAEYPQTSSGTPTNLNSKNQEPSLGNQNYDKIIEESIGSVGYQNIPSQFSSFDSTTTFPPSIVDEAKRKGNLEGIGAVFSGPSTINVLPSVEANSESTTLSTPSSTKEDSASNLQEVLPSVVRSSSTSSTQGPTTEISPSSAIGVRPHFPEGQKKSTSFSIEKSLQQPNPYPQLGIGFSTPTPFFGYQHSYLPPQFNTRILPGYSSIGNQRFQPMDWYNINNLHITAKPTTINYAEIVRSISFSFDSPEGRRQFELARSKGWLER